LGKYSTWKDAKNRLIPEAWPEYTPSFKIDKSDKIFTIGSCFARNIEEHLLRLGYDVPMMSFSVPKSEWLYRPNGILNKYSPPSILNELRWCERIRAKGGKVYFKDIKKLMFQCENGDLIDLHIGGYVPVKQNRALSRRQEIYDVFLNVFSSQVVIVTLGLVEVWYDTKNGLFIQRLPSNEMDREKGRFKFIRLNYKDCYDNVARSISLIRKHNPECKFIITTSPVPFKKTFTADDVIVANTYSKSVLRAVCGEIVTEIRGVDYFPSYENVTLTKDWSIYEQDMQHVSDEFVKKIVEKLVERYL